MHVSFEWKLNVSLLWHALYFYIYVIILDMNWTGLSWRQNLTTGRRSSLERPWSSMLLNRLCKQKYFRFFFSLKILNWIHARWSGCQLFLGLKISKKIAMYMHWQIKYFKIHPFKRPDNKDVYNFHPNDKIGKEV